MATDAENLPLGPEGLGQRGQSGLRALHGAHAGSTHHDSRSPAFPGICLFVSSELLEHIPTIGRGVLY